LALSYFAFVFDYLFCLDNDLVNGSQYFRTAKQMLSVQASKSKCKSNYDKKSIQYYFEQKKNESLRPFKRKENRSRESEDEEDSQNYDIHAYQNVVGEPKPKKMTKKHFNFFYKELKQNVPIKPFVRPTRRKSNQTCEDNDDSGESNSQSKSTQESEIEIANKKATSKPFIAPYKKKETKSSDATNEEISPEVKAILDDPRAKNLDSSIVDRVLNEIIDKGKGIDWSDIAGLNFAKESIREIVILPMLKPQLFVGLRSPSRGLLLFGPPGTGKTLIGKCIASQSFSTFFSISASSLTSKWIGEGEKMVRALFAIARIKQPSVIFIDEIDSLLTQRNDSEHESSRRLKTEFLVQFDGLNTDKEEKLLVIGATNRPQELDEAARRRFVKRLYIPLPSYEARKDLVNKLIQSEKHSLQEEDINRLCKMTKGYSGADLCSLCQEAALGPIRRISFELEKYDTKESLPPITFDDFVKALNGVKATVAQSDLSTLVEWNQTFGSVQCTEDVEDEEEINT